MAGQNRPRSTQYRFSVPDADAEVVEWIRAQENLSISLRYVIKQVVLTDGITDAFCRPASTLCRQPKRVEESTAGSMPPEQERVSAAQAPEQAAKSEPISVQAPVSPPPAPQPKSGITDADGFVDPELFFK